MSPFLQHKFTISFEKYKSNTKLSLIVLLTSKSTERTETKSEAPTFDA